MDAVIRRKSLSLTLLIHGLILLALFYFAITTRIPPFDENLAGGGGGSGSRWTVVDFGVDVSAAPSVNTPTPVAEQPSPSHEEEIITSDVEETVAAPVHDKKTTKKKVKETPVKTKKPVKEVVVAKPQ